MDKIWQSDREARKPLELWSKVKKPIGGQFLFLPKTIDKFYVFATFLISTFQEVRNLKKWTEIGLQLCGVIISMSVIIAIFVPSLPSRAEAEIRLPSNAVVAKGLGSEVHLSGTVVDVPFDNYRELSESFQDQKVILALDKETIVLHYLGSDGKFTYHATQRYSYFLGIATKTIQLEGNILKYDLEGAYTLDLLIITGGCIAGVVVLLVSLKKSRDC